jgi:Mg-chelatase subunit ChlD
MVRRSSSPWLAVALIGWSCGPTGTGLSGGLAGAEDDERNRSDQPLCSRSARVESQVDYRRPDVLLVVDKSGSMNRPLGGFSARWEVMNEGLDRLLRDSAEGIRFGLLLFPATGQCNLDVVHGIADANVEQIRGTLDATRPDGDTPTPSALLAAGQHFATLPTNPHGRYVLLATDGQPEGCNASFASTTEQVQQLAQKGIKTLVLGFGDGAPRAEDLELWARLGGTGSAYSAYSPDELSKAFAEIARKVSNIPDCSFELGQDNGNGANITVRAGNEVIPEDAADGWSYSAEENAVVFHGQSCQKLKSGAYGGLRFELDCPPRGGIDDESSGRGQPPKQVD